jgi:hypothetical protein
MVWKRLTRSSQFGCYSWPAGYFFPPRDERRRTVVVSPMKTFPSKIIVQDEPLPTNSQVMEHVRAASIEPSLLTTPHKHESLRFPCPDVKKKGGNPRVLYLGTCADGGFTRAWFFDTL